MTPDEVNKEVAPMRAEVVRHLIHFNTRPNMYIFGVEKNAIVAYLQGYVSGSEGQCTFLHMLARHIVKKYRIKYEAGGWPRQIELYGKRHAISWTEAYFLLSCEVLNAALRSAKNVELNEAPAAAVPPRPATSDP